MVCGPSTSLGAPPVSVRRRSRGTGRARGQRRQGPCSKIVGAKGVATFERAAFQAPLEPAYALRRAAVGEGIRRYGALGLTLKTVVADGAGGVERFLDVARLEYPALLLGMVRP